MIQTAKDELLEWVKAEELVTPEEVLEGIHAYPEALEFMFEGHNLGKLVVSIT